RTTRVHRQFSQSRAERLLGRRRNKWTRGFGHPSALVDGHFMGQHHHEYQPGCTKPLQLGLGARLVRRQHGDLEFEGGELLRSIATDGAKLADRLDWNRSQYFTVWSRQFSSLLRR